MSNPIPFADLEAQYKRLKPEIMLAVDEVFSSCAFVQGKYVQQFEKEFCKVLNVPHGIGCSSGTAALILALDALGVSGGDEVITVANTFMATAEAICRVGAKPVFVDIDPHTYTIDPEAVELAVTNKTKAIIPVHIYGMPCDMDRILDIASRHNLAVVEDCAQAHLATYKGRCVGGLGYAGTFSFYPAKNLGAFGDAGFVSSNRTEMTRQVRKLLDHGRSSKYEHEIVGYNHRMDGVQGAILSVKLRYLKEWTDARRAIAKRYDDILVKAGFKIQGKIKGGEPVCHLYVVEVSNRNEVVEYLAQNKIGFGIHYPIPLHLQPAFEELGCEKGDLPITESVSGRIISLPIYPELTERQVEQVCDVFLKVAKS